jgi:hypothetical protein
MFNPQHCKKEKKNKREGNWRMKRKIKKNIFLCVARDPTRNSSLIGNYSTTELYPQPKKYNVTSLV